MNFKIPNYLTIGRIIIVPIFVFTFYLPGIYGDILPFAFFVIASFTDFLDGLLARMFKDVSSSEENNDDLNYSFLSRTFSSLSKSQKEKILQILSNTSKFEKVG